MSLDLYRIMHGLDIQADDLASNANILIGTGVPGGDSAVQDAAPIGSLFLRVDEDATEKAQLFWKHSTAANAASDWSVAADREFVKALIQGVSWRKPVKVQDNTVYANTGEFPVTGTVDGVALADGDRVLFAGAAGTAKNIFIWNDAAKTWTEDANQESDGDAVLVQEGSHADEQVMFNGTEWVVIGSAQNAEELAKLRAFIGKDGAGDEMPTYNAAPNVVNNGDSLEKSIGELDKLHGNGDITNTAPTFALDSELLQNGGTLDVTGAFNKLNDAIGSRTYTTPGNVTDGAPNSDNINALNEKLIEVQKQGKESKGTAPAGVETTVDALTAADGTEVKWLLQVRETGSPQKVRALEIHAMNNGTDFDYNKASVLQVGGAIAGLNVKVVFNAGAMELHVNSTAGLDFVCKRVGFTKF